MPPFRSISFRSLISPFTAAAVLCACSSDIELEPLDPEMMQGGLGPQQAGVAGSDSRGDSGGDSGMSRPAPAGRAGEQPGGGEVTNPMLAMPTGSGGSSAGGSAGRGGAAGPVNSMGGAAAMAGDSMDGTSMGGDMGGPAIGGPATGGASGEPACADADADGHCDAVDLCPNSADDGSDHDADGTPDACDPCGIGVALGFSPLFYFPLDETDASAAAFNLGSVRQNGAYIGPIERGLAGVADPAGRAPRFDGEIDAEFSRVELLDVPAFPSTALTATFWVRTSQSGDYVVISYAIEGSANEFAVIVERDRLIVTLQSSTFQNLDIDRNLITDGTWHFVALTWDQAQAQFYFDGEAVGDPLITQAGYEIAESVSVPVTGPLALSPGGALILGQDQDSLDGDFSFEQAVVGGLDEVAIYDHVLTPDQIRLIFTATTCGERCDGIDNDNDGKTDEGFLGSSPACPAPSCEAIAASSNFGSGDYFSSVDPNTPLTCSF